MPPDSFFAGRSANGASPVAPSSSAIRQERSCAGLPEQAAEKLDVLADAEIGIEVLAQSLRHVGDARAQRVAVRVVRHVAAEDVNDPGLDPPGAGDHAQQGGFSHAVGSDEPNHAASRKFERDAVQRDGSAVALGYRVETCGRAAADHCGASPRSCGGQATAGSVRT